MKYRTKPVEVQAVQRAVENSDAEVDAFLVNGVPWPRIGDWVVKYPDGSYVVVPPEDFAATYEPADESPDRATKERAVIEAAMRWFYAESTADVSQAESDLEFACDALAALDASGPGEGKA